MKKPIVTREGRRIRLADVDPDDDAGLRNKSKAQARLAEDLERLRQLQLLLYADNRYALLVVIQAMDTGGKDGTIRS